MGLLPQKIKLSHDTHVYKVLVGAKCHSVLLSKGFLPLPCCFLCLKAATVDIIEQSLPTPELAGRQDVAASYIMAVVANACGKW